MLFRANKLKRIGVGHFLTEGMTIELPRSEGIHDPDLDPVLEAPESKPVMEKGPQPRNMEAPKHERPVD